MIVGPFGPYGHGSIIPAMEAITRNVALLLAKFQTQDIKSVAPKPAAVADFKQHREQYLQRTIWNAPCSAWFKLGPRGENIMMWPGSRLHAIDVFLNPRWEVSETKRSAPRSCVSQLTLRRRTTIGSISTGTDTVIGAMASPPRTRRRRARTRRGTSRVSSAIDAAILLDHSLLHHTLLSSRTALH